MPYYLSMNNETKTLKIGNREFTITACCPDGDIGRPLYWLEGKRGAKYATMRNVNRPEIMFLITRRGFGLAAGYETVMLTDANGTLEVVGAR